MSHQMNQFINDNKLNKISEDKNKFNQNSDLEKFNTYSNKSIDQAKNLQYGFNEILDIGKFNSKNLYENQPKERKMLVDQLFDESINHDKEIEDEDDNNLSSKFKAPDYQNIHLFTDRDVNEKNSSQLPLQNNIENNNLINFNINDIINVHKNSSLPLFHNAHNNIQDLKLDGLNKKENNKIDNKTTKSNQLNDKNYLISRLFSDNFSENGDYHNFNKDNKNAIQNKVSEASFANAKPENITNNGKIKPDMHNKQKVNMYSSINEFGGADRITMNNPNFIKAEGVNFHDDEKVRDSGTNFISRLNEKPFKSINFEEILLDNNADNDKMENNPQENEIFSNINNSKNNSVRDYQNTNKVENIIKDNVNNFRSTVSIPFNQSFEEEKNSVPEHEIPTYSADKIENEDDKKLEDKVKDNYRMNKYLVEEQNPFVNSIKGSNADVFKKTFPDESTFNLFDDSKIEQIIPNNGKENSLKFSKIKSNESNPKIVVDEIDIELDNDKINEDNNFNFNLGLANNSIKNFNDLEIKNQMKRNFNTNENIDINNFNSKEFDNFRSDNDKAKVQSNNTFFDNNLDFFSLTANQVKQNPKLEIKINSNQNKLQQNSLENNKSTTNLDLDMFKDVDQKNVLKKNFEFDFNNNNANNFANSNSSRKNSNNNYVIYNPFFEIKPNLNVNIAGNNDENNQTKLNNSNIPTGIANNPDDTLQTKLLHIENNENEFREKTKEREAEELMKKNQTINFDNIFDVLDKNEKKNKVHFNDDFNNNINLPADYINLDDFQSGKMNEYNNQAVNKNHNDDEIYDEIQEENNNINHIKGDGDSLYIESHREEDLLAQNGLFYDFSEKFETPFSKKGPISSKKLDQGKEKSKLKNDNIFTNNDSLGKINYFNLKHKKYFDCDQEVIVSQLEVIFMDVFANYDFDHLKKKLQNASKDNILRSENKIGYLTNLPIFKNNADLMNINPNRMKILESNIKYIREVKSDGNGFYRAFMFSLLESYIIHVNIEKIRDIVNDINELIDQPLSNNIEINKLEIFSIFNCILEVLDAKNKQIDQAYNILINAYGYSSNFDNCLNKYIRLALKKFILLNENFILRSSDYLYIKDSFPEEYFIDKQNIDTKSYIKERLLNFEFEADLSMICLAPIVFGIGLDMFVFEGVFKEDFNELKCFIQHIPSLVENYDNFLITQENIKLLYRMGRYSNLYSNQYSTKIENLLKFNNYLKSEKFSEKIEVISDFQCDVCKKDSHIIQIKKFNNLSFCANCLTSHLLKIISKRVKFLIQENYQNFEYYCRPILIDAKAKYQINDEELMYLVKSTIPKMVLGKFDSLCSGCQNTDIQGQTYKLNCPCVFCEKCLMNFINNATQGKIILNKFEKKSSLKNINANKKMLCRCGKLFDIELAITMKFANKESLIKKANERLILACKNCCINCTKDYSHLRNGKRIPGETLRFHNLKVVSDPKNIRNDIDICYDTHLLCKDCIPILKNELVSLIRKKTIKTKDRTYPIQCNICDVVHQIDSTNLTKIIRSEAGCCNIL